MDTSSESDSYDGTRGHRPRGRESSRRPGRDRAAGRGGGGRDDGRAADISDKISTLANTLQDTSRNLTKVDRMLGQYREHADDQAEAMAVLRENLEESISQLQTQRLSRTNGVHSASASTLHTSDLEPCSGSEGQRFYPTSPLRAYPDSPRRRRRSQSANVHFKEHSRAGEDIHALHQTLRDLRCDQQRLSDDLDKEILRRNRSDIDTRRAMESLTDHMTTSQRQDSVSSRVGRRLEELERERRPEQRGAVADELQESLERRQVQSQEREEAVTSKLRRAERDKSKMEQELEKARRLLEQSEDSRESLAQQVEDMRGELLRTRSEKTALQRAQMEASQLGAQQHGNPTEREGGRGRLQGSDLEKEVAELRAHLSRASVLGEVEELKRALEQKEKEKLQLSLQLKELSSDMARREQQQLRMLDQLRDLQNRGQDDRREMEALLQESTRSKKELKSRAQEAVNQWRAKCRRLQKELEEAREQAELHDDKALQVREASAALEQETRRQAAIQARLREENERLKEQADAQAQRRQRDRDAQAELQATLKQMTAAHAQQSQRLAEEESARKELQKGTSELRAKLTVLQQERDALSRQLQLEREVHQKELGNVKATHEDNRMKKDREVQEMFKVCRQERDELKAQLIEVKADAASDKELCAALHIKLDRMKDECDKLAAQLCTKEEARSLLHRKYQQVKQELEDKTRSGELRRASATELVRLEQKVMQLEAEQETVLTAMGEELDAACRSLARNGEDKLQAISQRPGLVKDPHHWLAETKTKLRWLCEEVQERDTKEQRLRKQCQQTRDQLKAFRRSRDSEQEALLQRLDQQEKLLHSLSTEKTELLERSRRKEEEMRSLQDRVLDLEMNTRAALDHLESIPEQNHLMEDFRDLEESQQLKELVGQRYMKYKEIVRDLQHQLDESKHRIQEYRHEKLDATSRSLRLAALSSSIKGSNSFLSSTMRSDLLATPKHRSSSDLDDSKHNGI
ncbi:centrosomal protein of 128 kDa isoform X2 [Kryptolebias marmoratus]|uniref:Centrosomal protein 128 n=1 Tax=Kryptolebias marmoratus TaxID=37003 RepID=A0A3Q2ZNG5_KRYMA|nr:centrosomal protein of 128 kDa isoform X2 [Kryptolebias marmoratus]